MITIGEKMRWYNDIHNHGVCTVINSDSVLGIFTVAREDGDHVIAFDEDEDRFWTRVTSDIKADR